MTQTSKSQTKTQQSSKGPSTKTYVIFFLVLLLIIISIAFALYFFVIKTGYTCSERGCVADKKGKFKNKEECQRNCIRYKCENAQCKESSTGTYKNIDDCENSNCKNTTVRRWKCNNNSCDETTDTTGTTYLQYSDCISSGCQSITPEPSNDCPTVKNGGKIKNVNGSCVCPDGFTGDDCDLSVTFGSGSNVYWQIRTSNGNLIFETP